MKLSEWSVKQGISYQTALRQFKENKLPKTVEATQAYPGATIFVEERNMNTSSNLFDLVIQFTNEKRSISEFASKLISLYDIVPKEVTHTEPVAQDPLTKDIVNHTIEIEKHFKDYIKENGPKVPDAYLKQLKEKAKRKKEETLSSVATIDKIKKAALFIKQESLKEEVQPIDQDIAVELKEYYKNSLSKEQFKEVNSIIEANTIVEKANSLPKTEKLASCTDITYNQNPNSVTFKTSSEVEEDYEK